MRAWLEEECKRPKSTVYLVCGFKALTDARVEPARHHETDISVSVAVPAAVIAGAAAVPAPIPLDSGLDVGGSPLLTSASSEKVGYTAAGEQVFAVQYRKIRFSRFSTKKADKAYLEKRQSLEIIPHHQGRTGRKGRRRWS